MPQTVTCLDMDGNQHTVDVENLRWRPSAYGIIIKDGCLLVAPQFGKYDLPGGGVELDETLEQAVVREVKEETGIDAANPRLLACQDSFFKLPDSVTSTKGRFAHSLLFYFACDQAGGELSVDGFTEDEKIYSTAPEWLPLNRLDSIQLASSFDWRPLVRQAAKQ